MKLVVNNIVISTDPKITNGVLADDLSHWTWSNENFDVVIAKGTSTYTLYKTAKAYMQLKTGNTLTVENKTGAKIHSVTIFATNATQLNNLKAAIGTQFEYTEDADALSVTIVVDSAENFTFGSVGKTTAYVSGVEVAYEKQ
jgi:hypothetical protein